MNGELQTAVIDSNGDTIALSRTVKPIYGKFLYIFYLFILTILFVTNSLFTLDSKLFIIHLASVLNPMCFFLLFWLPSFAKNRRTFRMNELDILILMMFIFHLAAAIFSSNRSQSFEYLAYTLLYIFFYYQTVSLLQTKEQLLHIVRIIIITGLVVVSMNYIYLSQHGFGLLGVLERYPFWTGKTTVGFYYSLISSFILGLLVAGWRSRFLSINILLGFLLLGSLASLALTFTRGSWLTMFFIFLVAGSLRFGKKFLLSSVIILLCFMIIFNGEIITMAKAVYNLNAGNVDDRIYLWKSSLNMLSDNPLFGIGPGTFNERYLESYQLLESFRWNASYHAHNVFLHLASEQGYLGLVAFLLFWGALMRRIYFNFKILKHKDRLLEGLNTGIFLCIITYFLWSLTNTSLSNVTKSFLHINFIIWFFCGLVVILPKLAESDD